MNSAIVMTVVETLIRENGGKPISSVFSGLNDAMRKAGMDPIAEINALRDAGKLHTAFRKGCKGVLISLQPFASNNPKVDRIASLLTDAQAVGRLRRK